MTQPQNPFQVQTVGQGASPGFGGTPGVTGTPPRPSWHNIRSGGGPPVQELIGLVNSWSTEPNRFGRYKFNLHLGSIQVLAADAPYPYSEVTIGINYSDTPTLNSGWGLFGQSIAHALGLELEEVDVDALKGKWVHLCRRDKINFGTNQQGQALIGNAWELVELVQPGQVVQPVYSVNGTAPAPSATQQLTTPVASTVVITPIATPAVVVAPAMPNSPLARAKELLHRKDLATFFQQALGDPLVRTDPALVNSIMTQAFTGGLIQSGDVVRGADGLHIVKGMP